MKRDLHDGAQQRLVHPVLRLKLATAMLERSGHPAIELVRDALESAEQTLAELWELVSGAMPSAFRDGGLHEAIDALIEAFDLPRVARVETTRDRLSRHVETTPYFVMVEALTNAVTHAKRYVWPSAPPSATECWSSKSANDGVGGAHSSRNRPGRRGRSRGEQRRRNRHHRPGRGCARRTTCAQARKRDDQ